MPFGVCRLGQTGPYITASSQALKRGPAENDRTAVLASRGGAIGRWDGYFFDFFAGRVFWACSRAQARISSSAMRGKSTLPLSQR